MVVMMMMMEGRRASDERWRRGWDDERLVSRRNGERLALVKDFFLTQEPVPTHAFNGKLRNGLRFTHRPQEYASATAGKYYVLCSQKYDSSAWTGMVVAVHGTLEQMLRIDFGHFGRPFRDRRSSPRKMRQMENP